MRIKLVSHASVIIYCGDVGIWSDPWLFGKAFNDSWSLLITPSISPEDYDRIQYIWVSHEHPDHFHIPTLKSLPAEFKSRVTVLFQKLPSDKMVKAFRAFGFSNIQTLPHRARISLTEGIECYCYHSRQIDSALALFHKGQTILNVNDVELSPADAKIIHRDIGPVDAMLNQFSYAGFNGDSNYDLTLPALARSIIDGMIRDHRALEAKVTIPFASFIYFSCEETRFLNRHINAPAAVHEAFKRNNLQCKFLVPGEVWDIGTDVESEKALRYYDEIYNGVEQMDYSITPPTPYEAIEQAFNKWVMHLRERYPRVILSMLRPIKAYVRDLQQLVEFCVATGAISARPYEHKDAHDLEISSQPLWMCFQSPFGIQTLGVSGRYFLKANRRCWLAYRALSALNNAEIYLKPKYVMRREFLSYLWKRKEGLLNQAISRISRALQRG